MRRQAKGRERELPNYPQQHFLHWLKSAVNLSTFGTTMQCSRSLSRFYFAQVGIPNFSWVTQWSSCVLADWAFQSQSSFYSMVRGNTDQQEEEEENDHRSAAQDNSIIIIIMLSSSVAVLLSEIGQPSCSGLNLLLLVRTISLSVGRPCQHRHTWSQNWLVPLSWECCVQ